MNAFWVLLKGVESMDRQKMNLFWNPCISAFSHTHINLVQCHGVGEWRAPFHLYAAWKFRSFSGWKKSLLVVIKPPTWLLICLPHFSPRKVPRRNILLEQSEERGFLFAVISESLGRKLLHSQEHKGIRAPWVRTACTGCSKPLSTEGRSLFNLTQPSKILWKFEPTLKCVIRYTGLGLCKDDFASLSVCLSLSFF